MKRSLFKFIILAAALSSVLCLTVSCKNSNSTSSDPSVRKLPFDNTAYLTIAHPSGESDLRRKLLHAALSAKLQTFTPIEESRKIKKGDAFKFKGDTYKFSTTDLAEYNNTRLNSAEVIVSYNDHLVIYFVPTGISREKALQQLGITLATEEQLMWVETSDPYLVKDKTYYLLNATNRELKENDVHYNEVITSIGSDFNEKYFSFSSNQIVEVKIKADYFDRETNYTVLSGRKKQCKSGDWESGLCAPCSYKMETVTGGLRKRVLESSELIDLDVIINGKNYPLVELKPLKDKEGNFILTLDMKKILTTEVGTIEFHKNDQYPLFKEVRGVEYTSSCIEQNLSNTIDVTPSQKVELEMNVKGRYFSF